MPHNFFLSDSDMANIVMSEEGYGFNYEWIAAGSGLGEEICGVDKDCIVVPTSPEILPKIEQIETSEIGDNYVEIQVMEEEVVADQWDTNHNGTEEDGLSFQVDSSQDEEEDIMVHLSKDRDKETRLKPYPCDVCNRCFQDNRELQDHIKSFHKSHVCNLCGVQYPEKDLLVEHMKVHAYFPMTLADDFDDLPPMPPEKTKPKPRRKKKSSKKYEYDGTIIKKQKSRNEHIFEDIKFDIDDLPQVERPPKFPILDERKPYVCQHCGVGFAREKALTSHTMVHVGDSAFECDSCGEMFQSEEHLEQHNSLRHGQLPKKRDDNYGSFQCPDCGVSFQWYNQLKKHQKTHAKIIAAPIAEVTTEDELSCSLCNVVFSSTDELLCHKQDHDPDIGVHSCFVCGEIYETLADLKGHMLHKHKNNHFCRFCDKVFKDTRALSKHLSTHVDTSRTFPCSICARRFHSKAKLKRHLATHDENKSTSSLVCRECGDSFYDGQTLLNHRQNVHGINISRLFPCMQCGKAFNSRSSHQIHLRIHTGERPYGCKYCWKAFGDGGTLRKHERIHTGEKPYVCPVCLKAFNQRVVLREHIRAHHSGPESRLSNNTSYYECSVCGATMESSSDLCAHLVLHSDENTAKHRTPKGNRKYVRKKKYGSSGFEEDSGSAGDDDRRRVIAPPPPPAPPQQPHMVSFTDDEYEPIVIKTEPDLIPASSELKGRARIVRSGRRGVPKGQNKRYIRGKTKASRLMNNTSYASKYVVSRPDIEQVSDELPETSYNGLAPRSRPRTKNVSYHNMKGEPRFELATFPSESKRTPSQRKRTPTKRDSPPETIENQYVNGIDLFEEPGGEQIETCIVDDIDVELKLEVKNTETEECCYSPEEVMIKTEFVSCDMCSEAFSSRSDLLKHIQIHI